MTYNLNIDDYIGRWGYSKQYVRNQLAGLKGKPVNVRISSLGGAVDDGLDIRQQFVDHGDVTAYLYGLVASSATIAALGAKKVCISRYCLFLVHKVSNWVDAWGQYNADQIQQLIDELKENKLQNDKFDLVLANMYAAKCNKKVDDILDDLNSGRWLTAQEALEYGFVDEIIEGDEDKLNLAAYEGKVNMLGLSPLPIASGSERDTADSHKLLNKILTKLDGLFSSKEKQSAPSIVSEMKKDYTKINTLLNVEGVEDSDGKVILTEEQVRAVNDRLDALETEVGEQKDLVRQRDEQIKNLQKSDGDTTTTSVKEDEKNDAVSAASMYDEVKDYI